MSLNLHVVVWRKGIIIPIYGIVLGITRKHARVVPGTVELLNNLVSFILYFLSFGCLEKSPSRPLKS